MQLWAQASDGLRHPGCRPAVPRSRILHISPGISHVILLPLHKLITLRTHSCTACPALDRHTPPRAPQLPQRQYGSATVDHTDAPVPQPQPQCSKEHKLPRAPPGGAQRVRLLGLLSPISGGPQSPSTCQGQAPPGRRSVLAARRRLRPKRRTGATRTSRMLCRLVAWKS